MGIFMEGLLNMSMQAIIVVLMVLLVRGIFNKMRVPKKMLLWLWLVPYVIMICPWKISSTLSFWRMPKEYGVNTTEKVFEAIIQPQALPQLQGDIAMEQLGNMGVIEWNSDMVIDSVTNVAERGAVNAADIPGIVWIVGLTSVFVYSIVSYFKLKKKVLCSERVQGNIYKADDITTAFVLGVICPKIYLPSGLNGEMRDYVLEHEKTHIRRRDPLKKILAFGITAVHWFNPFAWLAFHMFCKDMEMACDEETVLRIGMEKKQDYATALLQLSAERQIFAGVPLAFGENGVKDRVRNIVKLKRTWMVVTIVAVLVMVLLGVGFLTKYNVPADSEDTDQISANEADESDMSVEQNNGNAPQAVTTPEPTEAPASENYDSIRLEYPWTDLDGDGTEEYILVESGDFLGQNVENGRITVYVNNEPVYQYTEELRIMSVHVMEYLDLDGDGQEEIFVSFGPAVNSMPLEEWFVLKKVDEGWKLLEMHHNYENMLDNSFPITVVLKSGQFGFGIRCEGWDGEIEYDATARYERLKAEVEEWGNDAYTAYMEANHEIGDVVGGPMAYGIWEIQPGTYEGRNCLIAGHGLGGLWGKYEDYGWVYVYFDYDEEGKIRILDVTFEEITY